ncbi:hypothetical protein MAP00_007071 [Monascus purpureus]|nr:hypothetical protein MAP00_007071 [Monascus purpureus]
MVVKGVRSKVYQQVNLDDHDNSERKSRVLGRTENQYDRTLSLFDDFLELHPKASYPPDIRTYKGFMEFVSKNTRGRLGVFPTPETMEGFRRRFESALRLRRDYDMPNHISTTIMLFQPLLQIQRGRQRKLGAPLVGLADLYKNCRNIPRFVRRQYRCSAAWRTLAMPYH